MVYGKDAFALASGSAAPQLGVPDLGALAGALDHAMAQDFVPTVAESLIE